MLKVYIDLLCQPCRALYIFLNYTKIPHTIHKVGLMQGEHRQEEYGKINPFNVVPVIDDDGFVLPESIAILQYLSRKHNIDYLYPKDLKQRAKIEGFTHWQHLNLRYGTSNMFMALYREPLETGKPINQNRLALSTKVLNSSLTKMETIYLKDTPYLNSNAMSIADLLGACEVMQAQIGLGMDFSATFPKVRAWSELVRQTVGTALFDEAHKPLSMAGAAFKQMNVPTPKL